MRLITFRVLLFIAVTGLWIAVADTAMWGARLGNIIYEELEDRIVVTDVQYFFEGEILIPEAIDGKPVTEIADGAFEQSRASNIILAAAIEKVGDRVFKDTSYLTSIEVRDGSAHFSDLDGVLYNFDRTELIACPRAKNFTEGVFTVPADTRSIRPFAFEGCSLVRALLPESLEEVGIRPFNDCVNFEGVEVAIGNQRLSSRGGALINDYNRELIFYPQVPESDEFVVPPGVEVIREFAFYGTPIREVRVPEGILHLEEGAFYECETLETIHLPRSLLSIGDRAFAGCENLLDPLIRGDLQTLGVAAFLECKSLYNITLPAGISALPDNLFEGCIQLNRIWFAGGIESVGNRSFYGCENLTVIELEDSLESIGEEAFRYCKILGVVTLGDSLRSIGDAAFKDNGVLKEITLPESLVEMGNEVFSYCWALSTVHLPGSLDTIPGETFFNCLGLGSITIPSGIRAIGPAAFRRCWGLHTVEIEEGLEIIESSAFGESWNLKHVYLPDSVVKIEDGAFSDTKLETVVLPAGLKSLSSVAFSNNDQLKRLYFLGDAPSVDGDFIFGDVDPLAFFFRNKNGFSAPVWRGVTSVSMGNETSMKGWLFEEGYRPSEAGEFVGIINGISTIISFALGGVPGEYVHPGADFDSGVFSYSFYGIQEGIRYRVETSSDLQTWSANGVVLSEPDEHGFRVATVESMNDSCFFRLTVVDL